LKQGRPIIKILTSALLLIIISGCGFLEEKNLRESLQYRQEALKEANSRKYLDFFTKGYKDDWVDFAKLAKRTTETLKEEGAPKITFEEPEIIIEGNRALVTERFTMEVTGEGKPRRYDEVQHLRMTKTDRGWKCTKGSEVLRLLGGRVEQERAIEEVLLRREAALVKGDIKSYISLVSDDYSYEGKGIQEVMDTVKRNFQIYDEIKIRSYDRKIWFFGDSATVQQKFTLDATKLGEPISISGKERFELEKTEEGWKFTKGL